MRASRRAKFASHQSASRDRYLFVLFLDLSRRNSLSRSSSRHSASWAVSHFPLRHFASAASRCGAHAATRRSRCGVPCATRCVAPSVSDASRPLFLKCAKITDDLRYGIGSDVPFIVWPERAHRTLVVTEALYVAARPGHAAAINWASTSCTERVCAMDRMMARPVATCRHAGSVSSENSVSSVIPTVRWNLCEP